MNKHASTTDSRTTSTTPVLKLKHKQQYHDKDANATVIIPPNQTHTTNDLNYGAGSPITVVHIAEKPSTGQAIAVGLNSSSSSGGGTFKSYRESLPIHELTSSFDSGDGSGGSLKFPQAPYASLVIIWLPV